MKIVNAMCISKEKAIRHLDRVCLGVQNWVFVDRGEEEGGGSEI